MCIRIVSLLSAFIFTSYTSSMQVTYQWGLSARKGDRPTMEDTHICALDKGICALFDGHGGSQAAQIAKASLIGLFFQEQKSHSTTPLSSSSITRIFEDTLKN